VVQQKEAGVSPAGVKRSARRGQRWKRIEEVVAYAISHRTRIKILFLLNHSTYSTAELAEHMGESLSNVANHVRELLDAGSIEVAKEKRRGNKVVAILRAVRRPEYSEKDIAAMNLTERQNVFAFVIQSMFAEVMAALWEGTIRADPRSSFGWNFMNLDEQGRQEMADEQEGSWERLQEVEANSFNRIALSGGEPTTYIVGQIGFTRAQTVPKAPLSPNDE
jgi:DNA-binding transcriptional ArsR family regulator